MRHVIRTLRCRRMALLALLVAVLTVVGLAME
jgi:hypothetical protein